MVRNFYGALTVSDSGPVTDLTREAMVLFFRQLNPGGILAVHISNHYLDLEPVVLGGSRALDMIARTVDCGDDPSQDVHSADWVLVTKSSPGFDTMIVDASQPTASARNIRLWTDDYSNLFQILK